MENYDSSKDTVLHSKRVSELIYKVCMELMGRANNHDASKLREPEKAIFDEYTPKLKGSTYGSEEYKTFLKEMQKALDNHYALNPHHPEHYQDGINDMDLIDIIEMFCDWKAATERHANGSMEKSMIYNKDRFKISDQLIKIFQNTFKRYF